MAAMFDSLPRFSVSISSTHAADGPARMIERTQAAHDAGFAALTLGDHHDMAVPYAQNTPMLGRLLADWSGRPAGCLFLVPLWHPLLMAEQIGTLAATHRISAPGTNFVVQTGIGWGREQFVNLGADMTTRGRFIDEAIPVIKRLLAGEKVDSEYFGMVGAQVGLLPDFAAGGGFDWWIGGSANAAIDRAARLGDCFYVGPGASDEWLAPAIERYRAAGGTWVALRQDALVGRDANLARQAAEQLVAEGYRGMTADQLMTGSPDDVAERATRFASLGVDEIVVRCASRDQAEALETLTSIGTLL